MYTNKLSVAALLFILFVNIIAQSDWHFSGRNIASSKTATQLPGTYGNYRASLAVDGKTNSNFNARSCSHTSLHHGSASWTVNLGSSYHITGIRLYNRQDQRERLENFHVTGEPGSVVIYTDAGFGRYRYKVISISVDGLREFRSITVEIPPHAGAPDGNSSILTLCEVQIFAAPWKTGCYRIAHPEHGHAALISTNLRSLYSLNSIGSIITFSCDPEYSLNGSMNITCQPDGSYTAPIPTCTRTVSCFFSSNIQNGHYTPVYTSVFEVGNSVNVDCYAGYTLQGPNERICQKDSTWSGTNPICSIINCSYPGTIENGYYTLPDTTLYNMGIQAYKTKILSNCNDGYQPQYAQQRTCLNIGVWSGMQPVCTMVTCIYPGNIQSGYYTLRNNSRYESGYETYQSVIFPHCNDGYSSEKAQQRTCQSDGSWSGTRPVCYMINCEYPGNISNGYYTIQNGIRYSSENPGPISGGYYTYGNGTIYTSGEFKFSSVIAIHCNRGYELRSQFRNRTCTSSGNWDNDSPKCTQITCPWPQDFIGGQYQFQAQALPHNPLTFNTTIDVVCTAGLFKLSGSSLSRKCADDGHWTGDEPKCVALCNLTTLNNGKYKATSGPLNNSLYELGNTIHPVCDNGYELDKKSVNRTRKCSENHTWVGQEAKCYTIKTKSQANHEDNNAVIGGSVGGIVILIVIASVFIVLIVRKRRMQGDTNKMSSMRKYTETTRTKREVSTEAGEYAESQETRLDTPSRKINSKALSTPVYSNELLERSDQAYYSFSDTTKMPERAIKVEELSDLVFTGDTATTKYGKEFECFPLGMTEKHTEARKKQNRIKNRYKNLYAYDDTRVVLDIGADKSESDYINASYIHGFGQTKSYVAAQGATKENMNDIWRMIWQIDSGKIVMLTNLMEENKNKCDQYWPSEGSVAYGKITVTLRKSEKFSDFIIRTLRVRQDGAEERVVLQFHFTAWPDKSVPKYASSVVSFRNKVMNTDSKGKGPIVVHCSAGIGRTGTFIAIDYLTDQAQALGYVDVAGCVETLRRQRVNMVQTLDQYIFIHHVLVETLMLATSAIPSSRFPEAYKEVLEVDPVKRRRKLNVLFELLKKMSPVAEEHQYASAKIVRNRKKNRYSNILPADGFMPYLKPTGTRSEGDYINAIFLPSYKEKRAFIITQTPLESTKEDFWRMVYQHDVHTIVMMDDISEVKESEIYWPEVGTSMTFGDINVRHLAQEECDEYLAISLQMEHLQKTRTIKQIQSRQWAAGAPLPSEPTSILSIMEEVQTWQQHTGNHPVVVHCMNGADKSGLFCVISAVIERMKIEQDVAISQVIEEMRNCREQIITSVEQFQFCHEAVCAFMEQYETYSNFNA